MDSRERDQQPSRQVGHSLSSLIVRPSDSGGGGGGGGSDYEPGEVRRENPSRSDRFTEKNQGYGMHAGSVSPLRQRKVDRHYGMRAGSVSPLRQRNVDKHYETRADSTSPLQSRNVDKHYGTRADSTSPMHRRNVDKHCVVRVDSVSPLHQRTVDKHCVIHAGSVSPLRKRKADHRYGMHASSLSPLCQRNVDNYYGVRAGSISPLRQRNVDNHYGVHRGPISPLRQRKVDHHYDSGFDHPGGPRRGRGFRGGRGLGRFRDTSPPFGRGRGSRSFERGFDRPGPLQTRDEGIRNDPNISPREGDWICTDPTCGNLNFARREYCNHCNRVRFGHRGVGPGGSPHRRYIGPPSPRGPWPRIPGPPMNHGPERYRNEYDSPPREWGRDSPGSFGMDPPSTRHGGRFPDHIRRERPSYREDDEFSGRNKLDILMPPERGHKGRGNGDFFHERRRYDVRDERQPPPPPPPPPLSHRDHWVHDGRERSRSPMRGGPKDYRRVPYMGRGRADRRDFVRMRIQTRY